ncbi:helix-hairpin-helix domain-containing protein [Bosea psychrotolerans]|uniref:Helix-hairpin-helix DNA-binding protein n=1 Tax=Bosea psychrotolerans TaxID=1871628 RepID=A0A2S4LXE6_9HYPH|nr:helix-hairpin-helix domain-containing protein [Bosea psychrotolerans]POR47133.1 helix-hairpin-helix DNA-binding protein [Bosea psychrotolerans]
MNDLPTPIAENSALAAKLREYADLLTAQGADHFRIQAYRAAADVVEDQSRPISEIIKVEGRDGLTRLPAIGAGIASALAELAATGRWSQLARLRGELEPEILFRSVPGIGPKLADRIVRELHIDTLEALELAAHDGSLEAIEGFGTRRTQMVRTALNERLGRSRLQRGGSRETLPPLELLLDVDREYRERAKAGTLRTITPKRFNPQGEAWLPVLHTKRDDWSFTALYSNSPLAHELGRTHDWVIIYYHSSAGPEGQCTVVTAMKGPLEGQRIVRGRENEHEALAPQAVRSAELAVI